MENLEEVLERFNRKERNLLIRDILGHQVNRLQLSDDFRKRLTTALGLSTEIPKGAWWSTDYHMDWLAGALLSYLKGDPAPPIELNSGLVKGKRDSGLVRGNQEDIDLVVVDGDNLILVEAKAYGFFGSKQYTSKLGRLEGLYNFYQTLENDSENRVRFHFVLCSRNEPTKLTKKLLSWPCNHSDHPRNCAEVHWMKLECSELSSLRAVTRCHAGGDRSAEGDHWKVVPAKDAV